MKQPKNFKVIIIMIIVIALLILAFIIGQLILLKQDKNVNKNGQDNQIQQNQIQNNEEQTTNLNNEEQTMPIIPVINDIAGGAQGGEDQSPGGNNNTGLISSNYYYSQLDSTGKAIYDKLKQSKKQLITGTYEMDFNTQFNTLLHTDTGEAELDKAFQSAWNAFSYDEPDLFYIDVNKMTLIKEATSVGGIITYNVTIGPGENANYLKPSFQTKEQIEAAQEYLQNIVDQIIEQTTNNTDVQKATRIHDWLVATIEYEQTATNTKDEFTIYGALYNRKAVCEGYARAFKYLLEKVNVPCVLVSGTATNSQGVTESHAWNYVQINYQWYAVDVTWNDPVIIGGGQLEENAKRKYFLKGSETFFKDHKENGVVSQNSIKFQYPTLSMVDYK